MAYIFDEHKGKRDFEELIKSKLDALKTTFQDNVNSMYNALVGKGKTPTAKTPTAISTAITNIFDDVYTKFVNQGTTPSAKTVSGMSSAVDALATAKYNAGNTAGYNSGKTDGYNNGVAATKKGNAGAGDVLSGKTFTNSSSVNAAGTMANNGAKNYTVGVGSSQNIASGYHNGSGKVTGSISSATYITSQKESKTVSISNGVVGAYYIVMLSNQVPSNNLFKPTFTGCTSIQYDRDSSGNASYVTLFYAIVKCTNANMSITFNVGMSGIMVLLKLG